MPGPKLLKQGFLEHVAEEVLLGPDGGILQPVPERFPRGERDLRLRREVDALEERLEAGLVGVK